MLIVLTIVSVKNNERDILIRRSSVYKIIFILLVDAFSLSVADQFKIFLLFLLRPDIFLATINKFV